MVNAKIKIKPNIKRFPFVWQINVAKPIVVFFFAKVNRNVTKYVKLCEKV